MIVPNSFIDNNNELFILCVKSVIDKNWEAGVMFSSFMIEYSLGNQSFKGHSRTMTKL